MRRLFGVVFGGVEKEISWAKFVSKSVDFVKNVLK